jgi:hypothetical protein
VDGKTQHVRHRRPCDGNCNGGRRRRRRVSGTSEAATMQSPTVSAGEQAGEQAGEAESGERNGAGSYS